MGNGFECIWTIGSEIVLLTQKVLGDGIVGFEPKACDLYGGFGVELFVDFLLTSSDQEPQKGPYDQAISHLCAPCGKRSTLRCCPHRRRRFRSPASPGRL